MMAYIPVSAPGEIQSRNYCVQFRPHTPLLRQLVPTCSVPFLAPSNEQNAHVFLSTPTPSNRNVKFTTMGDSMNIPTDFMPNADQNLPCFIVLPGTESQNKIVNNTTSRPLYTVQLHNDLLASSLSDQQQLQPQQNGYFPFPLVPKSTSLHNENDIAHLFIMQNADNANNSNTRHCVPQGMAPNADTLVNFSRMFSSSRKNLQDNKNASNVGSYAQANKGIFNLLSTGNLINNNSNSNYNYNYNYNYNNNNNNLQINDIKVKMQFEETSPPMSAENPCMESIFQKEKSDTIDTPYSPNRWNNSVSLKQEDSQATDRNPPRKYECKECTKVFNNRHNLSHHMRYHRNDRRFRCEICEKSFFQKIHLIEHRRIHTGEKPHACPVCGRRFRHSTNLKRHVKSIHLNEHFQCQYCSLSFKRKATLKRHVMKIHLIPGST